MSAASYSRTSRPRTDRVSYDRSSAGRAGAASGYRGARYVSSSLAEELSFERRPPSRWCPVPVAAPRARASRRPRFPWRRPARHLHRHSAHRHGPRGHHLGCRFLRA